MSRKNVIRIVGGLVIGLGLGLAVALLGGDLTKRPEIAAAVDAQAPDFTLEDLAGNSISLSDMRGRTVLINFWATWCGPCRVEMPALQSRFEMHDPDLAVLAVDFDEPKEQVQAFSDELGLTFDVLLDPGGEIQRLYLVRGYPSSVFVDPSGIIRIIHIGIMTEGQLDGYLADLGLLVE